jgi:hypothetical protein
MLPPEPIRYRNKGTQFGTGMLRYRTERPDAGMLMPAASAPMPSYVYWLPSSAKGTPATAGISATVESPIIVLASAAGIPATVESPTIVQASAGSPTAEEMRETIWT